MDALHSYIHCKKTEDAEVRAKRVKLFFHYEFYKYIILWTLFSQVYVTQMDFLNDEKTVVKYRKLQVNWNSITGLFP